MFAPGSEAESRWETLTTRMQDRARRLAALEAEQIRDMAALDADWAGTDLADFVADEIAATLTLNPNAAIDRLGLARTLTRRLTATLAALSRGDIDLYRARIIAECTARLTDELAREVEARVLGKAAEQTPTKLRATVRREVLAVDPAGSEQRRKAAREDRKVEVYGEEDAMATLSALLPAEEAAIVFKSVDQLARAAAADPDETRTLDQLRADFMVQIHREILETGSWSPRPMTTPKRATPHVQVTIDLLTLLGLREDPAYLDGYGPVPPEVARALAADATWQRIILDPAYGHVLDVGTTRYRPGKLLAEHVINRNRTCVFRGCNRPAVGCDLDHTVPYPHGPTADSNLGPLCRHHHRAKQAGFRVRQTVPGTFEWTTPAGQNFTVDPADLGPPDGSGDDDDMKSAWLDWLYAEWLAGRLPEVPTEFWLNHLTDIEAA